MTEPEKKTPDIITDKRATSATILEAAMFGVAFGICLGTGVGIWPAVGVGLAANIVSTVLVRNMIGRYQNKFFTGLGVAALTSVSVGAYIESARPAPAPEKEKTTVTEPGALTSKFDGVCKGSTIELMPDGKTVSVGTPAGCTIILDAGKIKPVPAAPEKKP